MKQKSRRQIKAAKAREAKTEQQAKEQATLVSGALKLKTMVGGFSDLTIKTKPHRTLNSLNLKRDFFVPAEFPRTTPKYPSASPVFIPVPGKKVLDPELAQRELKAQAEIEAKKKRVAVLYNKGGYQYITDGMDPKTFGRK